MMEMEGGWYLLSTRQLDQLTLRIMIKFTGTEVEIMQESIISGMVIREDTINFTLEEIRAVYSWISDTPEIFYELTPLSDMTLSA